MREPSHISVLLQESLALFESIGGRCFADLTFGEGGHTHALLSADAASVIAIDRDSDAIETYREIGQFRHDPRLVLVHDRFSNLSNHIPAASLDGVLADLGVSTRQMLEASRGFSLNAAGPLDMRMDTENGKTLKEVLSKISSDALAEELEKNTDLKGARRIAERVLAEFRNGAIQDTADLARLIPGSGRRVHPATVLFLGLRMWVNRELDEIHEGLHAAFDCLKPGGRLVVITFHSTEDRAVKRILRRLGGKCICGALDPLTCNCPREERAKLVLKHPSVPSWEEIRRNPRSRSAKLRCIEKL